MRKESLNLLEKLSNYDTKKLQKIEIENKINKIIKLLKEEGKDKIKNIITENKEKNSMVIRGYVEPMKEPNIEDCIEGLFKYNLFLDDLNNDEHFIKTSINSKFNEKSEFSLMGSIILDIKTETDKLIQCLEKDNSMVIEGFEFNYGVEMSSGERAMLGLFSRFYSIKDKVENGENLLFVLDETEMFMHPEWQRKFLSIFITFVNMAFKDNKVQIILTSHSPFVASDLPKENIIKLDMYGEEDKEVINGEQEVGNCKVEKIGIDTFGANIMDLYDEAFFLDSSFGEFSRGKIKDVINNIENELVDKKEAENSLTSEEIEYIISSIGEPLVKNRLEKMWGEYIERQNPKLNKVKRLMTKYDLTKKDVEEMLGEIDD